jgi:hypothetical protein
MHVRAGSTGFYGLENPVDIEKINIMKTNNHSICLPFVPVMLALSAILFAGCRSSESTCAQKPETPAAPVAAPPATPASAAPAALAFPMRIKAASTAPLKDADGNTWLPEQGFADGDTVEREDLQIENTKTPALYRSEHYSMSLISVKVPNGKYTVKLHFCETFEGIEGPGQRVFSFNVMGHEFKDFDVWAKAGGPRKAYVQTINDVNVTGGTLEIKFTSNVENPQINALEIIPAT